MSRNPSDKESELFSDTNITKSCKTYSRSKTLSPSKGTIKQQQKNPDKDYVHQQKKLLESVQKKFLNKETSVTFRDVPSLSLKVNGYGTQIKNSFKSANNGTAEFCKDFDEMEFLSTKSNHCNKPEIEITPVEVSKKICNGEYARTRRNLVQKISHAADSGKNRNMNEKSSASLSSNSSDIFSISSIISKSPTRILTFPKKGFVGDGSKTISSPSAPKTLSLMDMVRKYSLNPSSISLSISNPEKKEPTEKEVSSISKNSQRHVSPPCPPSVKKLAENQNRLLSTKKSPISSVKAYSPVHENSSPKKSHKEKTVRQRKNGIKTPKKQLKSITNCKKRKYTKKCKETEVSISNVLSQSNNCNEDKNVPNSKFNKNSLKRFHEGMDKISKKIKTTDGSLVISDKFVKNHNISTPSPFSGGQVNPAEISKFLDSEIENSLSKAMTPNNNVISLASPALPQSTNLNSLVPSTALLPSVPLSNTITNAYVTSDNNLVYSVNPYVPAFQPTLPNSQSTIFVIPVPCLSCNHVPQQHNSNNSQTAPPFYQINCTGQNIESCVRNIVKSYYPQSQLNLGIPNNNSFQMYPNTMSSLSTINILNENINMKQNISNAPLFDILASNVQSNFESKDVLVESDSESEVPDELVTIDRSASLLGHFYDVMEKQSKLSVKQCKEQVKEMFDTLFSKELSVEAFCTCPDVPEFFSNFCFKDPYRKQTNYKFDPDFKNSSLVDVLKQYISEHIKKILKNLSPDPLLKFDEVLKADNSNLSLAEKLLMEKILGAKKGIGLRDLIGALFFAGIITIFKEYKEIHQKQRDC